MVEYDGFGMLKTTYGLRATPNSKRGGFTLTLVKRPGIIRDCTLKVSFPSNDDVSETRLTQI